MIYAILYLKAMQMNDKIKKSMGYAFRSRARLHWTKVKFLLIELYMCMRGI